MRQGLPPYLYDGGSAVTQKERRIVVGVEYDKATSIMQQIEGLLSLGHWDNIANRLYYALFHAVSALLCSSMTNIQ